MALSAERSARIQSVKPDPDFYADLWGSKRKTARAESANPKPRLSNELRNRAGFVALLAGILLLGQMFIGLGAASDPQVVLSAPSPAVEPRSTEVTDSAALSASLAEIRPTTVVSTAPPPPESTGVAEAIPVILDTDIANDIDDSLALALLHGYRSEGKVDLLAVTLNGDGAGAASYIDAVNTFYRAGDIPIGAPAAGSVRLSPNSFPTPIVLAPDRFPYDVAINAKAGAGLDDAVTVLRRQLAGQPDNSVVIVSTGFPTNLSQLLASPPDAISPLDGTTLVETKVRLLSIMAGRFDQPLPEFNVQRATPAAQHVFTAWPTPLIATGWRLGADLPFPTATLADTVGADHNPVVEAARVFGANSLGVDGPYDQPSFDLVAVVYPIEGADGYLTVGPAGHISADTAGVTTFTPDENGHHRLVQRPAEATVAQDIINRYIELISRASAG